MRRAGSLQAVLAMALMVAAAPAWSQSNDRVEVATGQRLLRTVDAITGRSIGFALVSMDRPRLEAFTSETGRLLLPSLGRGSHVLRVRQLGYTPVVLTLEAGDAVEPRDLVVRLTPRPLELPTLEAQACLAPEDLDAGTRLVLDEASENARRIGLLQRSHPYRARYQRIRRYRDRVGTEAGTTVDTFTAQSDGTVFYQPGKAIVRLIGRYDVAYFTIEAVLAREFRKTHCFWIAGADSAGDGRIRLGFAPVASLKGPDWEGELVVDRGGVLRNSSARLVVARPQKGWPTAAACRVDYEEAAELLLTEGMLRCGVIGPGPDFYENEEQWRLLCRTFTRKPPSPDMPQCAVSGGGAGDIY